MSKKAILEVDATAMPRESEISCPPKSFLIYKIMIKLKWSLQATKFCDFNVTIDDQNSSQARR